jgi:hypothetical protein
MMGFNHNHPTQETITENRAGDEGSEVSLGGEIEENTLIRLLGALGMANVEEEQKKVLRALKQKLEMS